MSMWSRFVFSLLLVVALTTSPVIAFAAIPTLIDGDKVPTLAPLIERTSPAVVNISVAGTKASRQAMAGPFPFFFAPNKQHLAREMPFKGLGSGVIIDADKGYVITNNHVIDDADEIKVTLNDGREFEATVVGKDKNTDIALLQISSDKLTEIALANSDELRVGDFAIAIGNPFGLGQTVTSGIISALARSGLNIEAVENFIQTDAAINQGNSGGALVNLHGELIGMNTAIIAPGGGNIGIGFAIPSNMVKSLTAQLIQFGEVRRGMLGITGQELSPELAKAFNTQVNKGAFVSQVMSGSAANKAGIEAGDVITEVDNKAVSSFAELRARISTAGVGKAVLLTVVRDGQTRQFNVVLQAAKEQMLAAKQLNPLFEGATLNNSRDKNLLGVAVSKVVQGSPAARLGLKEGDIILRVNRQRIENIKQLEQALKVIGHQGLALNIKRGDSSLYLVINSNHTK